MARPRWQPGARIHTSFDPGPSNSRKNPATGRMRRRGGPTSGPSGNASRLAKTAFPAGPRASAAITSHDTAATSEYESGEERVSITFRGGGGRPERTDRAQPRGGGRAPLNYTP